MPLRLNRSKSILSVGLVLVLAAPQSLPSAEIEKVKFAENHLIDDVRLDLANVALMRYKVVIKAFVAALYLEKGATTGEALDDVGKRIEIEYFWALKGVDISKAADEVLAKNLSAKQIQRLRPRIDRMNRLYVDVKPGDRYTLTYLPGAGTTLSLNGKTLGVVPGKDFASAYFTIWLGRQPMDVPLRDQLLQPR